MNRPGSNKAEVEYAVMLAVLDFHTEFMKSNYAHVQVQMQDGVIEVTLAVPLLPTSNWSEISGAAPVT